QIIGWLYQFYISEKKDQVIGKVVKSEDIPAATQLFTPNWIVKYLVQNSVGRLWMMAQPDSTLANNWEYYIQPAEQTDEVNAQLKQLIDVRISEDGDTLNPESITVLDPACGSGHILVEAYDCLKAIYLERGYRSRDIPRLILENNLYGIDIDTRAAQLASFALLMKAREDDRRLFSNPPKLNIIALQDSQPERLDALSQDLANTGIAQADLKELLELFEHASTFGSLIQVPEVFAKKLPDLETKLNIALASGDIFAQQSAQELLPLVQQANLLAKQYDAVIANPPYMGGKGMNTALKDFAKKKFPDSKSDLFAMFIERGFGWCKESGFNSMVTMQSWMFLSSYEAMREKLLQDRTIQTMAHLGARAFPEISGEVVQTTAFVMQGQHINGFKPVFFRLVDTGQDQKESELRSGLNRFDSTIQDDFKKIPGSPIAYWVNIQTRNLFSGNKLLGEISEPRRGLATNDNNKFIRRWAEVSNQKMAFGSINREDAKNSNKKWFPYNKGGEFRKWYGNNEYLVNWENDGEEMFALAKKLYGSPTRTIKNLQYYFRNGISWSMIGSGTFSVRYMDNGYIFDQAADSLFARNNELLEIIGLMNSPVLEFLKIIINPTMNTTAGVISQLPYVPFSASNQARENVEEMIKFARDDWNVYETSWDFTQNPIIRTQQSNLEQAFNTWQQQNADAVAEMKRLEEENNKLFIDAYGLQDELTPDVPDEQITLTRADREKDSQRLVSYVLGCMMGRYSLDEPGLIYAHAGNQDFDANRYLKFPADADGIIPLTEMHWFEDDATHRIREFLTAVWGKDTLDANMQWLAESLDKKANETAEDTIRRYLASKFYKDHMQTYKKRPIYWLFSSGKQGAFQALVYLHRYNESTLARMRTEYVMPLISKMAAYANSLETTKESSDSAAEIKRIEKKLQDLHKQQAELSTFEEKLRHYADQRITLDLDDGVKVNYGKFGDLLAEVKAITGDKTE
ncbi:BREX-1 system adenine-specific DNA-methyltransferase PglX, partial [Acinetobacter baumannii]